MPKWGAALRGVIEPFKLELRNVVRAEFGARLGDDESLKIVAVLTSADAFVTALKADHLATDLQADVRMRLSKAGTTLTIGQGGELHARATRAIASLRPAITAAALVNAGLKKRADFEGPEAAKRLETANRAALARWADKTAAKLAARYAGGAAAPAAQGTRGDFKSAAAKKPFSMPVEGAFFISGRGMIATGKIATGAVTVGDTVSLVRGGKSRRVKIAAIEVFRKQLRSASVGASVSLLVAGSKKGDFSRGDKLVGPAKTGAKKRK